DHRVLPSLPTRRSSDLAEGDDVAALLHGHADRDAVLAHEAHARVARVGVAAADGRDVTERHGPLAGADRQRAHLLDRLELPAHRSEEHTSELQSRENLV